MTYYENYEDEDKKFVTSILNLAKFNNGVFKSFKQKVFLMKSFENEFYNKSYLSDVGIAETDVNFAKVFCGEYIMNWTTYGSKSQRWMGWVFEYDTFGIKRIWRLHYSYKDNVTINKAKTELEWKRNEEILEVEHLIEGERLDNEAKKALEEKKAISNFIGEVGDKIETTVKVTFTKFLENEDYRFSSTMFLMEDDNKNKLVWFSSSMNGSDFENDKEYKIKGRIKALNEFRGEKQTVMTRCKLVAIEA